MLTKEEIASLKEAQTKLANIIKNPTNEGDYWQGIALLNLHNQIGDVYESVRERRQADAKARGVKLVID